MSLASLLLKGDNGTVDNELDSLFVSQPAPPLQPTTIAKPKPDQEETSKRKRKESLVGKPPQSSTKRPKPDIVSKPSGKLASATSSKRHKESKKPSKRDESPDSDEEENDPTLEDNYLRRAAVNKKASVPEKSSKSKSDETSNDASSDASNDNDEATERDEDSEDSESEKEDYDTNVSPPKHETASSQIQSKRTRAKKVKYIPPDETRAQRDARTVFIRNVSMDIVKSRPAQKQLKRYVIELVPEAKIESIRFRSIAFSAPTTSMKANDEKEKKSDAPSLSTKEKRQMERAETWRSENKAKDHAAEGKRKKQGDLSDDDQQQKSAQPTLTPAQRKRVAFYKHEFHDEMDSANAYVVLAHTPGNDVVLHPAEAARLLVEKGNGTVFMSRTLTMDRVGQWRLGLNTGVENSVNSEISVDPPRTLFVGNLDFATKEEDLRSFFNTLVSKEKNGLLLPKDQSTIHEHDEASPSKKKSWVQDVRIIRDKDTQLGKGFAYIKFIDRECVDELLALEPDSVKFAKRKLRLQRCKGVPGATPKSTPVVKTSNQNPSQKKAKPKTNPVSRRKSLDTPVTIPKGDPSLGAKLATLSKEERKAVKAADSSRLERRLAKKRAKVLQTKGKTGTEKLNKHRNRQRKSSNSTGSKKSQSGSKKVRVLSNKSLAKRNLKK